MFPLSWLRGNMEKDKTEKIKVALMTYAIDGRLAKGTAIVSRHAVEEFLKHQDEFEFTFLHYEKSDEPIYTHGVREIIFPTFKINFLNKRFVRQIYYFLTTKDRYDIVEWFQPRAYPLFWLVPAKKIIFWIHGAGDLGGENLKTRDLGRDMFNFVLKRFNRKVDLAFAGSEFARQDVIKKYGFKDPETVRVLNYAKDDCYYKRSVEDVKSLKQKFNLPERFLLNVARLNPGKNAFAVIKAFNKFADESTDKSIHFVNLGAHGSEEKEVKEFILNSKHKDRIHLLDGTLDRENDLPTLYSASLGLVFPLLNEGFGLPLIEAMACHVPTVASDTCFPDLTSDMTILVDALSVDSIKEGMKKLIEDTENTRKIIEGGFAKSQSMTWQKMGENKLEFYRKLL